MEDLIHFNPMVLPAGWGNRGERSTWAQEEEEEAD